LRELNGKDIVFGAIDVGTEEVETADVVADRLRRALEHVPAERLFPCTDCGLVPRTRDASRGKMRALAAGAAIVRAELTSTRQRELAVP
jgi:5-methyltetrahydropteroyltriglutamate--homocysteine methyltransferase